ncbi:MAG: hypothetical protein AAF363_05750 [Bacteroidota bacterium]
MDKYKLVQKGTFEKLPKFEHRINELSTQGWKPISVSGQGTLITVLFERRS